MRVYVVRHGKAIQMSDTGRDVDRDLKPRGERQAAWLGERLSEMMPGGGRVLASPAVRAWRTGLAIAEALGVDLEEEGALLVNEPVSGAIELVERLMDDVEDLILVGHEPQVSGLGMALTRGVGGGGGVRTGECLVVEVDVERARSSGALGAGRLVEVLRLEE